MNEDLSNSVFSSLIFTKRKFSFIFVQYALYNGNIKKFDVVKLVINGDDAFVTYNGWTNDGKLFRNTEYFKLKDGKIMSNECFFGPGVNYPNNKEKQKN